MPGWWIYFYGDDIHEVQFSLFFYHETSYISNICTPELGTLNWPAVTQILCANSTISSLLLWEICHHSSDFYLHPINVKYVPDAQMSSWVWFQPMRDDVTLYRLLSLAQLMSRHTHTSCFVVVCCMDPAWLSLTMMTSSNGNIFRVTGHLCGEFTGPGEFPTQRPVTRSFDVFFDLRLNKRLNKQPWGWWFETPSWSLWRQCNANERKCDN